MEGPRYTLEDLLYLMQRLRDPATGCPWDLKQNFQSIAPYTLEEVYEVIDAIETEDFDQLRDELGDLLFQVVFYSQLGKEQNSFEFTDITHAIVSKLLQRHPHVFPDGTLQSQRSPNEQISEQQIKTTWEAKKKTERQGKGNKGILDDIPKALPSLIRAEKIQKRASNEGFDWTEITPVIDKIEEEINELREVIAKKNPADIEDEFGDVLFSLVNASRHLGVNADTSLRKATAKFERRFQYVEAQALASGRVVQDLSQSEMETFWQEAKSEEV